MLRAGMIGGKLYLERICAECSKIFSEEPEIKRVYSFSRRRIGLIVCKDCGSSDQLVEMLIKLRGWLKI